MYVCQDCGHIFASAHSYNEKHLLDSPPFEKRNACPSCKSELLFKKEVSHCRCCGARLSHGKVDYCDDTCRRRDKKLREMEEKRNRKRSVDPLFAAVRELEVYNRSNNTRYSYGQYVAIIKPRLKKGGKAHDR